MNSTSFFGDMLQAITDRGRKLLFAGQRDEDADPIHSLEQLCETLLSSRGEASGMALAKAILDRWMRLDRDGQRAFLLRLVTGFDADTVRLERAIEAYRKEPGPKSQMELHLAAEPRRQELLRRFNLAPNGTETLVRMREALLSMKGETPELNVLDADFAHLFASWFNRGFLMLRQINWSTPADILEKIIKYEAVHQIDSWEALRMRLAPPDRRCFAFFHPQLADDPLIFVEVALTRDIPAAISEVLRDDRTQIDAAEATTAVFYSISNCQEGLRGISFGNFLIKQVVEDLRRELPRLSTFVTLSPVPGFAAWLKREREQEGTGALTALDKVRLSALDQSGWNQDQAQVAQLQPLLTDAAAWYFLRARDERGRVIDPVARFHLGNGARLERINVLGDVSDRALRQSHGLMVNYLYKLDDIEANHEAFVGRSEVVAAQPIRRLVPQDRTARALPAAIERADPAASSKGSKEYMQ